MMPPGGLACLGCGASGPREQPLAVWLALRSSTLAMRDLQCSVVLKADKLDMVTLLLVEDVLFAVLSTPG